MYFAVTSKPFHRVHASDKTRKAQVSPLQFPLYSWGFPPQMFCYAGKSRRSGKLYNLLKTPQGLWSFCYALWVNSMLVGQLLKSLSPKYSLALFWWQALPLPQDHAATWGTRGHGWPGSLWRAWEHLQRRLWRRNQSLNVAWLSAAEIGGESF